MAGAGRQESAIPVMVECYIGVGSNLGDPVQQVKSAFTALDKLPEGQLCSTSSLYISDPLGPPGQPRYVNAVVHLTTTLSAESLLDSLQQIENEHGRERSTRWGARTLDLDLLLYGQQVIATQRLTVPHPEMSSRSFVLLPLLEIDPNIQIPGLGSARTLSSGVSDLDIERLETEKFTPEASAVKNPGAP